MSYCYQTRGIVSGSVIGMELWETILQCVWRGIAEGNNADLVQTGA